MSAKVHTRSQKMAQVAYEAVCRCKEESKDPKDFKDYRSFALSFPALIHNCGLAQAFTFAAAKKQAEYAKHLC